MEKITNYTEDTPNDEQRTPERSLERVYSTPSGELRHAVKVTGEDQGEGCVIQLLTNRPAAGSDLGEVSITEIHPMSPNDDRLIERKHLSSCFALQSRILLVHSQDNFRTSRKGGL